MFSLELATKDSGTVVINFQCSAGEGVVGFVPLTKFLPTYMKAGSLSSIG